MSKFLLDDPKTGTHRAKTWEIGFYALNNTSTNIMMMMMAYVSYYVGGIMGVAFTLVGVLLTVMRVWDGVTDPIIGFIVDKTNGKFGKNRPFIAVGLGIMLITTFVLYHFGHLLPQNYALRLFFFIVIYAIYIVGYTCQCVVTKSAQTCMTNDPKQRPTFAIFDSIYNTVLFMLLGILVSNYLVPKYTTEVDGTAISGFMNPAMFNELWIICASLATLFAIFAIIGIRRKDRAKYFGTGEAQRIRLRDYWEVLRHNRAIQMLVISASTDKLFMGIQANTTIMVVLFGVLFGNIAYQGQVNLITMVPTLLFAILGMRLIASRMGQKKALLFGTWGAIVSSLALFALMVFGDVRSFSLSALNFFTIGFLVLRICQGGFANISGNIVIPMTADCADYEVYRSGKYVPGLMGTLFSFVDKVISSLGTTIVSLMFAAVGYAQAVPNDKSPYSEGLFWVIVIALTLIPIIGWICNVISMKFYPLTKEKMVEIQEKIAEIKAQHNDGKDIAAAMESMEEISQ